MRLAEFLDCYDFSYQINENGKYQFVDLMSANLGGICEEEFDSPAEMVERLQGSIYEQDYVIEDFEDITQLDSTIMNYQEMAECLEKSGEKTILIDILKTLNNPESVEV